ncbi:uncharacterized protein [Coffea arabica]|uniref:PGG domain-containing protein n=1 Tax=Coffea arabica TaxID=13443 RepID=A0A6P6TQN3_COFAR|nr:ankyrin repeat-containing protein BDA1-like [Coffea arabica]
MEKNSKRLLEKSSKRAEQQIPSTIDKSVLNGNKGTQFERLRQKSREGEIQKRLRQETREEEMGERLNDAAVKGDAETHLCDAAVKGDAATLQRLIGEDQLLLDKVSLNCQDKNPLHIAAMLGHVAFVQAILGVNSDMCLVPDRFGRNPLHIAAIKGRLAVLQELIHARPLAAREKTEGGGNILHLCVKYNQLGALQFLVQTIRDHEFLNAKNDDGMSILHLAVCDKQNETIKYLLRNKVVDVNTKTANGNTALDLIHGDINSEIARSLEDAGAKRAKDISPSATAGNDWQENKSHSQPSQGGDWLARTRNALMVVASLIATMAFQAGVNPAGGVWQDDKTDYPNPHNAGEAVMAHSHPKYYKNFIRVNTVAFVSSLSTIMFLISGLPFRRKFFMWCLMVIMWLTISAIALTYGISIVIVTPKDYRKQLSHVIETAVTVWCGVMALLLLGNTIRLINRWFKTRGNNVDPRIKRAVQSQSNDKNEGLQMC